MPKETLIKYLETDLAEWAKRHGHVNVERYAQLLASSLKDYNLRPAAAQDDPPDLPVGN